jgi:hypothetical protein
MAVEARQASKIGKPCALRGCRCSYSSSFGAPQPCERETSITARRACLLGPTGFRGGRAFSRWGGPIALSVVRVLTQTLLAPLESPFSS